MRRGLVIGFSALVLLAAVLATYLTAFPKIGHATRAEIESALPASLRDSDPPAPAAKARYARLLALAKTLDKKPLRDYGERTATGDVYHRAGTTPENEAILRRIDALLTEGAIRAPESVGIPSLDFTAAKDAAKATAYAVEAARQRGDSAACGRWASLGLRFGRAMRMAGGVVIDALVAIAVDSIAIRTAYVAEIEGGLDEKGRAALLALLPPEDGRAPEMADAVRRDFDQYFLPILLDPQGHAKEIASYGIDYDAWSPPANPELVGTLDPVATGRLAGGIYAATIDDLRRPYWQASHDGVRLMEDAARGLPDPGGVPPPNDNAGDRSADAWARLKYRVAMNSGRNTLGRQIATFGVLGSLGQASAREAANRNLLRAVLLIRMGRPADLLDPLSGGRLRLDRKRKVVWSAGTNGKDDGGMIGRGGDPIQKDYGYPYGNRSFHPNPNGPFRAAPPGMPPLP